MNHDVPPIYSISPGMLRLRRWNPFSDRSGRLLGLAIAGVLAGCQAQRPDVPADAARLTGIDNAIVFREQPELIDSTLAPDGLLTPAMAIRLALKHDPRIQASLARVRAAEADANQARLLPNPILSLDLRYPTGPNSNTAFEPQLTTDLIGILQKPAQISAADNRLRASAQTALVTVLGVMSEVQEAYAAARSADAEIANATRRRQLLQRLRDLAQKRLDAGEATRLDVLTLDSQLLQSNLEVSDFQLQRVDERLILGRLLGRPRSAANWQLSPWQAPPEAALASESTWIDAALHSRPEIRARLWELRALGDDYRLAGLSPFLPSDFGVHAEHDPDWRVGPTATLPLPIFDFGQATRAKITALRIAARHEIYEQQLEVIQEVRTTYADYLHWQRTLNVSQSTLLPLQRQQLEQAQLAYQTGDADLTTLLLAETQLELTLSKIVELQEKVTVAQVRLERAAGGAGVAGHLPPGAVAPTPPPAIAPPSTTRAATTGPAEAVDEPSTSQPASGVAP